MISPPRSSSRARPRALALLVVALLVGADLATARPALAADPPPAAAATAEHLFEEGRTLMASGKYADACPKLAESHRLDPGVGTLLNLGDCYEKLGRTASAWATYREAETLAHRAGQKERAAHSAARADALKKELSYLVIDVASDTPGIVVKRDGEAVGQPVWSTRVPIDPGEHTIEASAPGYLAKSQKVNVAARSEQRVAVGGLARAPVTATSEAPSGPGTQRLVGYGIGGAGIVAAGVGVVFGAIAKSRNDDARDNLCSDVDCTQAGADKIESAQSAATISTVLVVAGAALVAGGVALVFTAPKRAATTGSAHPQPWATLPLSLLGGTF